MPAARCQPLGHLCVCAGHRYRKGAFQLRCGLSEMDLEAFPRDHLRDIFAAVQPAHRHQPRVRHTCCACTTMASIHLSLTACNGGGRPPDQGPSLSVYHAVFASGAEGSAKDISAAVTRDKLPHAGGALHPQQGLRCLHSSSRQNIPCSQFSQVHCSSSMLKSEPGLPRQLTRSSCRRC